MSRMNGNHTGSASYGPGGDQPLIFNRPELQEGRRRWVFWALTFLAWIAWAYLWLPVITLLGWYLGFRTFVREIVLPDPRTMLTSGLIYLGIVAFIAILLIGWSRYNLKRFGGADRRRFPGVVADEEVCQWFGISPELLATLRAEPSLSVVYDEEGTLEEAAVPTPRSGADAPAKPAEVARDPDPVPASRGG